jgi:hypothetical protein
LLAFKRLLTIFPFIISFNNFFGRS